MERVLVVADFDWSYVLLMVSFSVYSFVRHSIESRDIVMMMQL